MGLHNLSSQELPASGEGLCCVACLHSDMHKIAHAPQLPAGQSAEHISDEGGVPICLKN